jgi:hypothetical protein
MILAKERYDRKPFPIVYSRFYNYFVLNYEPVETNLIPFSCPGAPGQL